MSHQPNPDNSHDHTYPTKPEGLSIAPFPERATYRMDAMERRIAALEKLIIASAPTQRQNVRWRLKQSPMQQQRKSWPTSTATDRTPPCRRSTF